MSGRTRRALRTAQAIVDAGLASPERLEELQRVAARYAVAITPTMAGLIDPDDASDPIARQFIPDGRELQTLPEEHPDPIGDHAHSPLPGLVHRYPDRVLLKISSVCPVYCRFCFRREMVGPDLGHSLSPEQWAAALDYIRARPEIWEVIFTGGDPFVLSDRRIAEVTQSVAAIEHVKVLRWHTRVPVVAPERITPDLVAALKFGGKTTWVALHANHPRELTPQARAACAGLIQSGVPMVSQSVLLKGVNDDAETLALLMRAFVETGIKPYYLHHGDLAPGTSHLRAGIAEGQALMAALRRKVSGLAQPAYMLDIPGGHGKVPIGPAYLDPNPGELLRVRDSAGVSHILPGAAATPANRRGEATYHSPEHKKT
jgi:lysine 2,3-aminomutase